MRKNKKHEKFRIGLFIPLVVIPDKQSLRAAEVCAIRDPCDIAAPANGSRLSPG